ncbi:MAG: argininosuccinate synthase [Candidatus Omnitrophica bacterium]|nr:argininosuccinate synthase [Candidatus Omnitrophota bacterium]
MKNKVILAYSGGLDTTVCISWLRDKDYEVIAFTADLGQGQKDRDALIARAKIAGASKVILKDLRKEFIEEYAFNTLKAGAIYEGKYYLSTALSRPLIAKYLVKVARKENAQAVAHGCTGKGNDQVRFEVGIKALNPNLEIIAPLRNWEFKSRKEEIEFLKEKNIPIPLKKSKYSIDRNLWGVSIECGELENIRCEAPEDIFILTASPSRAPDKPQEIEIGFEKGIPASLNGKRYSPVELVERLNKIGGRHGIGRVDMVENRLVGIKSREVYEAPAAVLLYLAHQELESLVLDRETLHFKRLISLKYAELVYYGLWFTPLREGLQKFVDYTQQKVSGKVRLRLYKGNVKIISRQSPYSLYSEEMATYSEKDKFDHQASEGFIKIWSLPFIRRK